MALTGAFSWAVGVWRLWVKAEIESRVVRRVGGAAS
jgi:hypothetical protein